MGRRKGCSSSCWV